MTRGEGQDESRGSGEGADRQQDPIVGRGRPDPAQPPEKTLTLTGFLGDSDRPGFRRLYFTRDLDYYAEFRAEDVVHVAPIPADQQPFMGEDATRVNLRRDATVDYTRTRAARPLDEFDIDVRFGRPVRANFACAHTDCDFDTCHTCVTRCVGTCVTDCGQATCATCDTCETQCNRATCVTCPTCATCRGDTCPAITCDTCPATVCDTECHPTRQNPPCPPRIFTRVC